MIVRSRVPALGIFLLATAGACATSTGPGTVSPTHPAGVIYGTTAIAGRPFALAVSPHGVVLVGLADVAEVGLGALPDTGLTQSVSVGTEPTGLAVNPAGTRGYAADQFSNSIDVIDLASLQVVDAIPVSGNPFIVLADNAGNPILRNSLFVSSNTDTIYHFASNHAVISAVGGPATANALVQSSDGRHLYASYPDAGLVQDILMRDLPVIDMSVHRTFSIPGRPQGLALSGDGTTLYVANEASQYLYLVNLVAGAVVDSIGVGGSGFALAMTPDNTQLYLTRSSAGLVTIVTLATRDTASLAVGGAPRRMGFDGTGAHAVIANETGWVTYIH